MNDDPSIWNMEYFLASYDIPTLSILKYVLLQENEPRSDRQTANDIIDSFPVPVPQLLHCVPNRSCLLDH
jgi:hypothetical protein